VGAPQQALDDDAPLGRGREQLGHRGPVVAEFLVGVAAPVGEEEVVTLLETVHLGH
jgi:hypothetical protein